MRIAVTLAVGWIVLCPQPIRAEEAVVLKEFVYETAPIPSCHASTLIEVSPGHILAAWFGGKEEGDPSVGIWLAHRTGAGWSAPVEVAKHDGVPCWNPVLVRDRETGKIVLFYKAGPSPERWSGLRIVSEDGGKTWSRAEMLPAGILGPIKNKPYRLEDGTLLCGSSVESWNAWGCRCEITPDLGETWRVGNPINLPDNLHGLIQPTIFRAGPGTLRMFMRARRPIGKICESVSTDEGETWSPARPTELPNPSSGIDAVNFGDGRIALVYNPTVRERSPISLAISSDGGESFRKVLDLDEEDGEEFSYPAVIETSDGKIATVYTWKREKVRFVLVDPTSID